MAKLIDDIPNIDIVVKKESLLEDIFQIYTRLFPTVTDPLQLHFEQLSGGIINNITKVSLKNGDPDEAIIFWTIGMKLKLAKLL